MVGGKSSGEGVIGAIGGVTVGESPRLEDFLRIKKCCRGSDDPTTEVLKGPVR